MSVSSPDPNFHGKQNRSNRWVNNARADRAVFPVRYWKRRRRMRRKRTMRRSCRQGGRETHTVWGAFCPVSDSYVRPPF